MKSIYILIFTLFLLPGRKALFAQNKSYSIAFYNLENLFDTINNEGVRDGEFTPQGSKNWDIERYNTKLKNLSQVIYQVGKDAGSRKGPDLIGLCEVENRGVLEDLVNERQIKKCNYQIVHFDSPDKRGIDVALLFKAETFMLESSVPYTLYLTDPVSGKRIFTRDQLLVTGNLGEEKVSIIVNHWPSRWGGEQKSRPLRLAAAQLSRHIVDSLMKADSLAQIIVMGDFNDDPINLSVETYLYAATDSSDLNKKQLYNPSAKMFLEGKGSLKYRGKWNIFDQIIVSQSLINASTTPLYLFAFRVFKKDYLLQKDGPYEGYPLRTYGGKNYLGGYSDHLPVYIILKVLE